MLEKKQEILSNSPVPQLIIDLPWIYYMANVHSPLSYHNFKVSMLVYPTEIQLNN